MHYARPETVRSIILERGWDHLLLRFVWVVIAATTATVTVYSIPQSYQEAQNVCYDSGCRDDLSRLLPSGAAFLEAANVSLATYALISTIFFLTTYLVFLGVATLIYLRSDDRIAYLVSLALLFLGSVHFLPQSGGTFGFLLEATHNYLLFVTLILGFYLFPSGRFVPRWSRWVVLAHLITEFFYSYFPDAPFSPHNFSPALETTIWIGALVLIPVLQIYRFRVISTPSERQQTKWVVSGLVVALVGVFSVVGMGLTFPSASQPLLRLVAYPLITLSFLAIPLSLAVAILRYRLWDIDFFIRKTLLYVLLTTVLVLIYLGSVTVLQSIVSAVSGQQSALATVLSTLAIATLFNPLRQRIQNLIDCRFYRRKYDVQQVLNIFAQTVRDEVALETLGHELLRVVEETMQPAHATLWLRPMRESER